MKELNFNEEFEEITEECTFIIEGGCRATGCNDYIISGSINPL